MANFLQYMGAGLLSGAGEGMEKEANLRLKQEAEKAQQLRAEHLATFQSNLAIKQQGEQNKYLSGQQEKKNKFTDAQTDKKLAGAEKVARIRAKSKKVKTGLKEMPGYVKDMFKHQKVDPKTGEPVLDMDGKPIYEQDLEGQNKLTSFMMENGITDWNKGYALHKQIQGKADEAKTNAAAAATNAKFMALSDDELKATIRNFNTEQARAFGAVASPELRARIKAFSNKPTSTKSKQPESHRTPNQKAFSDFMAKREAKQAGVDKTRKIADLKKSLVTLRHNMASAPQISKHSLQRVIDEKTEELRKLLAQPVSEGGNAGLLEN